MKNSETLSNVQTILETEAMQTPNNPSSACLAHSGFVTAFKFIAKDQDSQWAAIRSVDKRMWAVVVGMILLVGEMVIKHLISQ
jgi:hypothetical protein